ncbi:hypothetical protein [Naasia aerilata]|uniref:Oligosaccharide repeat unit polymerase n=1 Tax=Naasia aerilata TaxID=1162966 RepID=A0ABN6XM00_9MICO|nr:hypothetical protein [Naasia aerilata]BDZ45926.1 hypothetical protein GCM10025866_18350 [Naasia aerilata]
MTPAPLTGPWLVLARFVALAAILLLSSRQFLGQGITFGHLASLALIPLWLPAFRRYAGGLWIAVLGLLGLIFSLWLTDVASLDHIVTQNNLISNTLLLVGTVAAVGVIFWARDFLPIWALALVYGVGMLISALTREESFLVNPWKFALAVPLAVVLLALAEWTGKRSLQVIALLVLAAASLAFDSRAYFGQFLLAAVLVGWQLIPLLPGRKGSAARVLFTFAVIAIVVFVASSQLIANGVLGEEAQARTVEQQDRAGNVLLGGRPEAAATVALFLFRPLGFGAGALANSNDVQVAKTGMHQINYDPNNGYVENFLFGQKFELHSMLGDLWAYFGWAGIAFAALSLVLLLHVVGRGVADRTVGGVVMFVATQSLWNLFFNPLYTSAPVLALALGLGLAAKYRGSAGRDGALTAPAIAAAR